MYVIYNKKTSEILDFTADPSGYINNTQYGFKQTTDAKMYEVYKRIGDGKTIAYFNPNEDKYYYEEKPMSAFQKETEALGLLREYSIYLQFPLNQKLETEILERLTLDLEVCGDIVVAKGETELDVPTIDYV